MYDRRAVSTSKRKLIQPIDGPATYKGQVYRELYALIQNLDLAPGERLVEQDLSDRFGVSKTPIREALLQLGKDRLVDMVPHTGVTVSWLSLTDYEQQLFILDALELPALELVQRHATPEEFAAWDVDVDQIKTALAEGELRTYRSAIAALHAKMFATAGYPRLTELIAATQQALYRYGVLLVDPSADAQERELDIVVERFELLRGGDVVGAAKLVRAHHQAQLEVVRALVEGRDARIMPFLIEGQ
jgi:DNA-binding GntR family transcriptional regulator